MTIRIDAGLCKDLSVRGPAWCDREGCRILPARVLCQTDEFAVERQFLTVQTMLFEHLLGFTGGDVADRGADPERDEETCPHGFRAAIEPLT
ncbi:hypothetical protein ACH4TY_32210 [Streptomyces anulatus]